MKTGLTILIAVLCVSAVVILSTRHHAPAAAAAQTAQDVHTTRTLDAADLYQAGIFYQWAERLDTKLKVIHDDEEHQIEIKSVKAVPGHYICAEIYLMNLKQTVRYVLSPKKLVPLAISEGAKGEEFWEVMECNSEKAIEMHPKD